MLEERAGHRRGITPGRSGERKELGWGVSQKKITNKQLYHGSNRQWMA
jgi:hypothetical protein